MGEFGEFLMGDPASPFYTVLVLLWIVWGLLYVVCKVGTFFEKKRKRDPNQIPSS